MMSFQVVKYLGSGHQVLLDKGLGGVTSFCDTEAFLELRGFFLRYWATIGFESIPSLV